MSASSCERSCASRHLHFRERLGDLPLTLVEKRNRDRDAEARDFLVRLLHIPRLQRGRRNPQVALELQPVARALLFRKGLLQLRIVPGDLTAQGIEIRQLRNGSDDAAHAEILTGSDADEISQRELRLPHPHRRAVPDALRVQHLGLGTNQVELRRFPHPRPQPDAISDLAQKLDVLFGDPELLLTLQHFVEIRLYLREQLSAKSEGARLSGAQARFRRAPARIAHGCILDRLRHADTPCGP